MEKVNFNFDNIDKNVYIRDESTKRLLHRDIAFREIYRKNRKKYPLPFSKYIVHHIDGNKLNNRIKNLLILTHEEHMKIHNLPFDRLMQVNIDQILHNFNQMNEEEIIEMFKKIRKKSI
jgi:L-lysine 2,3-aminomutase